MRLPPKRFSGILLVLLALFCAAGCALPRIIVLEDPLTAEEHLKLGHAYEERGEYAQALKEYQAATRDLDLAWYLIGNLYFKQKAYDSAERAYEKAIRRMPERPEPYNNLAWLLYTRNRELNRAESLARRALELAPADRKAEYRHTLQEILRTREKK